jgi:protein MAK11
LQGHSGTINALTFANDGTLVSCSDDGTICIWEVGEPACLLKTLKGHRGPVSSISLHPSGKLAMSVSLKDGTVRTWNLLAGRSLYVKNMKSTIKAEIVRWSNDGSRFILISNSKISVYNLETTKCTVEINLSVPVITAEFLPKCKVFITGDSKGCIHLYSISSSTAIHKFQAHDARIKSINPFVPPETFSGSELEIWVASASSDETIKLWKLTFKNKDQTEEITAMEEKLIVKIDTGARLTSVTAWYAGMLTPYKMLNLHPQRSKQETAITTTTKTETGSDTTKSQTSNETTQELKSSLDDKSDSSYDIIKVKSVQKRKKKIEPKKKKKSKLSIADLM